MERREQERDGEKILSTARPRDEARQGGEPREEETGPHSRAVACQTAHEQDEKEDGGSGQEEVHGVRGMSSGRAQPRERPEVERAGDRPVEGPWLRPESRDRICLNPGQENEIVPEVAQTENRQREDSRH